MHVAVDPVWRGKGVTSAMIEKIVGWASKETEEIQVGTQGRNYAANALYGKMGFALVESQYSLHGHWLS